MTDEAEVIVAETMLDGAPIPETSDGWLKDVDMTELAEIVPKPIVVDVEDDGPGAIVIAVPDPSMRVFVELVSWVLSKVASLLADRSTVVWAGDSVTSADWDDELVRFCVSVMPAETSSD